VGVWECVGRVCVYMCVGGGGGLCVGKCVYPCPGVCRGMAASNGRTRMREGKTRVIQAEGGLGTAAAARL
jgi:hypothetical protein